MNHRIRLGPIAVFLVVIAVVLTTLAVLTIATSNADQVMAERFARVTQIKYELEDEGEKYLQEVDEKAKAGGITAESVGAEDTENGFRKTISKEGYDLVIEITDPGAGDDYEVVRWEIVKIWNAEDPLNNIWQGGN